MEELFSDDGTTMEKLAELARQQREIGYDALEAAEWFKERQSPQKKTRQPKTSGIELSYQQDSFATANVKIVKANNVPLQGPKSSSQTRT